MDERAVIGHQQQPRGVVIQTAYRLHIAQRELIRQDGQHAGVMTGFSGAFEIARLVQRDINLLTKNPGFIKNREFQSIRFNLRIRVGVRHPVDADIARNYQVTAPLARAKTLRMQDAIQC